MENNKKSKVIFVLIIVICILAVILAILGFKLKNSLNNTNDGTSKSNSIKESYKVIQSKNGFLSANNVDTSKFVIKSNDDTYGPYTLNITENKYLSIRLNDEGAIKNIGYIKLNDDERYSAIWQSEKLKFLCIKISDKWYFFDDKGNIIELNKDVMDTVEKTIETSNETKTTQITENTETTAKNSVDDSDIIYIEPRNFNQFKLAVTKNSELIIYKYENGERKIYQKIKYYLPLDKLKDEEFIRKNGPGFYADYNNNNSNNIRIRIDKYPDNSLERYSNIWYTINGLTGELISTQEYIDNVNYIYKQENKYNGFSIGVTNNSEIVLYKIENHINKVYYKMKTNITEEQIKNEEFVRRNGPGFYADYNNLDSGNIRIRVDHFSGKMNGSYALKDEIIWYEFNGSTGQLISTNQG